MLLIEGFELDYVIEEDLLFDVINRGGKFESSIMFFVVWFIGEGLYNVVVGKILSFVLVVWEGVEMVKYDIDVCIEIFDLIIFICNIIENSLCFYIISYKLRIYGEYVIMVLICGEYVEESFYMVDVKKGYMCFVIKFFFVCLWFGYKGKGRGELIGLSDVVVVCNGIIVVVDMLNDRI